MKLLERIWVERTGGTGSESVGSVAEPKGLYYEWNTPES